MSGTFPSPADRGRCAAELCRAAPAGVRRAVDRAIRSRSNSAERDAPDLPADVCGLARDGAVARWRRQTRQPFDVVSAALAAMYVDRVWAEAPGLLAGYVRALTDPVARVLRPAAKTMRLDYDCELSEALSSPGAGDVRLSVLGPLALFFLVSVARSRAAWDVLVGTDRPEAAAFGWAPTAEKISWTLRTLLLAQGGRRFRPNALMYSPLAHYLVDLGAVQRVNMLVRRCPCGALVRNDLCARCGGPGEETVVRRIFSKRYLAHCDRRIVGNKVVIVSPSRMGRPYVDDRLTDLAAAPDQDADRSADWSRARRVALQAGSNMLSDLVRAPARAIKQIAVCAAIAEADDPCRWLVRLPATDGPVMARLVDRLLAERTAGREGHVAVTNRHIRRLASRLNVSRWGPTNSGQFGRRAEPDGRTGRIGGSEHGMGIQVRGSMIRSW